MTNLDEMLAWLDAPRAAQEETDEGKEAFALTCAIHEHDAHARKCELAPLPDPDAQRQRMKGFEATRAELAQRLDALCSGATVDQLNAQDAAPHEATGIPGARILKKIALVAELAGEWPSIEQDLQDASRNGLKDAAHTGEHGLWRPDMALKWARERGKLNKLQGPVSAVASPWDGLGRN